MSGNLDSASYPLSVSKVPSVTPIFVGFSSSDDVIACAMPTAAMIVGRRALRDG
jgi:hypothetical protein